ncbi:MAG TPA: HlyD family secretion protein [Myxococcota bacterium]|nr:HlyD family secretion protein [Myxococcota bacterium]
MTLSLRRALPHSLRESLRAQSRRTLVLGALALVLLPLALVFGWRSVRFAQTHESTDDAYVDGSTATVAPRIAGTVTAVSVGSNWSVEAGQLLLQLDPRDYQVKLDQAQAQLERARQTIDQLHAEYGAAVSSLALSQQRLHQAELDFSRAEQLNSAGVVSRDSYDRMDTALRVARADRDLAEHRVEQARAALGNAPDAANPYDTALVHEAEAAVEAAKLDLAYTEVRAPFAGTVVNKHAEVGDRVQLGQPLMSIVPPSARLYVTANFKETQLGDLRLGQAAEIKADIYPGTVFLAHVDSLSMGTGAAFALLPPENATGNWVKVVQRVPVKLVLDSPPPADKPLRMGLSVEATVDIRDTNGPLLASLSQMRSNSSSTDH